MPQRIRAHDQQSFSVDIYTFKSFQTSLKKDDELYLFISIKCLQERNILQNTNSYSILLPLSAVQHTEGIALDIPVTDDRILPRVPTVLVDQGVAHLGLYLHDGLDVHSVYVLYPDRSGQHCCGCVSSVLHLVSCSYRSVLVRYQYYLR